MRRGRLIFALSIFVSFLFGAGLSQAETLTWNILGEHPNTVQLEFHAVDTAGSWPGDGEVYVIDDDEEHSYTLQCSAGERICYGAWVKGDPDAYWGTGPDGNEACDDCCFVCNGGETPLRVFAE
jgi:hypothetical protein